VDVCLIPEIDVPLEGPDGLFEHLHAVIRKQGYAVVVVAEGAGENFMGEAAEVDEGGNRVLPDLGPFLSSKIKAFFKAQKTPVSIKYHDPSYMVRSVPADAEDSIYCQSIAQNAVHGAMCGYTAFTSGVVNNRTVLLPMQVITATSPSSLNPNGRTWERVLSLTHQPKWEAKLSPKLSHRQG
jgi:6-phosphofructokinase 1